MTDSSRESLWAYILDKNDTKNNFGGALCLYSKQNNTSLKTAMASHIISMCIWMCEYMLAREMHAKIEFTD